MFKKVCGKGFRKRFGQLSGQVFGEGVRKVVRKVVRKGFRKGCQESCQEQQSSRKSSRDGNNSKSGGRGRSGSRSGANLPPPKRQTRHRVKQQKDQMGPETQLTDGQGPCLKNASGDQCDDGTEQQKKPTKRTPRFESVLHS